MLRSDVQELDLDGVILYHALLRDLVPDKLRNDRADATGTRAADDNGNALAGRHSEAGEEIAGVCIYIRREMVGRCRGMCMPVERAYSSA